MTPLGEPRLARVDVARQFSVPDELGAEAIAALADALALTVFRDPKTKGCTARGGGKETSFRLYDKTAESQLPAVDGNRTWRFEVQLRGRATGGAKLDRLDVLEAEPALAAAYRVFKRSRLSTVISSSTLEVRTVLQRAVSEGGKNIEQIIGFAVLRELGITSTKHRGTRARYARALDAMGLPSLLTPTGACFRLDWESGYALPGVEAGGVASA